MVIVTLSERSGNWDDVFMGIWDTRSDAENWIDAEYPDWSPTYTVQIENDVSWVGSHQTAIVAMRLYREGDFGSAYRTVSFISPNQ